MKSSQSYLERHQNNLFSANFKEMEDWNDGTGATYVNSSD